METGTFPKTGTGTQEDPIRPDFSSLDGTVIMWESVGGETATTMTVRYQITIPDDSTDTP
jgi:hypothetical protein